VWLRGTFAMANGASDFRLAVRLMRRGIGEMEFEAGI
jgi:hypothetical protein